MRTAPGQAWFHQMHVCTIQDTNAFVFNALIQVHFCEPVNMNYCVTCEYQIKPECTCRCPRSSAGPLHCICAHGDISLDSEASK